MLAVAAALQISYGAGRSRHGLVAVTTEHEVDGAVRAEITGGIVRRSVNQENGGVALSGRFQFRGNAVSDGIIFPDGIALTGEFRRHDAAGVVDGEADDADPDRDAVPLGIHGLFLHDDVIAGGGYPLAVPVEIGAEDGHRVDAVLPLPFIIKHCGVGIHQRLEIPVELVIADGDGVIAHPVHRNVDGFALEQVGHRCALVDVAPVQQQETALVVLVAPPADVIDLVGDIGHAVVDRTAAFADQIAVQVRGLDERQEVFSRQRGHFFLFLPVGIRDPGGLFLAAGGEKDGDKRCIYEDRDASFHSGTKLVL